MEPAAPRILTGSRTRRVGRQVAVDGAVLGLSSARALQSALNERGIELRTDLDVLNDVWDDRAALPAQRVYEHLAPFAATARADKAPRCASR